MSTTTGPSETSLKNQAVAKRRAELAREMRERSDSVPVVVSPEHASRSSANVIKKNLAVRPEWQGFSFSVLVNEGGTYDIVAQFPALVRQDHIPDRDAKVVEVLSRPGEWVQLSTHPTRSAAQGAKNRARGKDVWNGFRFVTSHLPDGQYALCVSTPSVVDDPEGQEGATAGPGAPPALP